MSTRQCSYCGKLSPDYLRTCPGCREDFPDAPTTRKEYSAGRGEMRRGLLYLLLAGVIHYFASGYSSMELPVEVSPMITLYLTPALAVGGLGFVIFGFVSRRTR